MYNEYDDDIYGYNNDDEFDEFDDCDEEVEEEYEDDDKSIEVASLNNDKYRRKRIGMKILQSADEDEKNDINFLISIHKDYYLTIPTVMAFASERLLDMYCVGDLYLSPLFKNEYEKREFVVAKLKEWDKETNKKDIAYSEKKILTKVYHVSGLYAGSIIKYMYSRTQHIKPNIMSKLRKLIKYIDLKFANLTHTVKKEHIAKYRALLDDCLKNARANNLKWLVNNNSLKMQTYANDTADSVGEGATAYFMAEENLEIIQLLLKAKRILDKGTIKYEDILNLNQIFERINQFVILAYNEYKEIQAEKYEK